MLLNPFLRNIVYPLMHGRTVASPSQKCAIELWAAQVYLRKELCVRGACVAQWAKPSYEFVVKL